MAESHTHEGRISAVEAEIEIWTDELKRVRDRVHKLESSQAAVKLMGQQMEALTEELRASRGTFESLAKRVAQETVVEAFADQNNIAEVRKDRKRDRLKTWLMGLSVGAAFGGLAVSLILVFTNHA